MGTTAPMAALAPVDRPSPRELGEIGVEVELEL